MRANQSELFEEFPPGSNPHSDYAEFRVDKKVVQVPISFWKDGRANYDLTRLGGEIVRSRDPSKAQKQAEDQLRNIFQTGEVQAIEIVRNHFAQRQTQFPRPRRARKKDLRAGEFDIDLVYANPFQESSKNFGKCPEWLLERRDLKPAEKVIYARLLFPLRPICERFDQKLGVIIELNQEELAKSVGMRRSTANGWLISLQVKRWLKCEGNQGAKQTTRFLWKEGMPETCRYVRQVATTTCRESQQQPVDTSGKTCWHGRQVSEAIEKGESKEAAATEAELSDKEWLVKVVHAKYSDWSPTDLQLQWTLHGTKADRKRSWIKGDREHFLKAWMPRARNPRAGKRSVGAVSTAGEPEWWKDFIDECYPDAPKITYAEIAARLPDVIAEGLRWAATRTGGSPS